MTNHTAARRFQPYLRLSSELQKQGYGLESQESDVRRYVTFQEGVIVEPIFKDVITGDSAARPELDQLRALLHSNKFDAVVFPRVDRAGRKAVVTLEVCAEILDAGVELHFADMGRIENTPQGRFILSIFASAAELDKATLVANLTKGRREKAQGKSGIPRPVGNGPRPFGFTFEGKKENTRILEVEDEVKVIQRIYMLLYNGNDEYPGPLTPNEVAAKLTDERVPSHHDNIGGKILDKKKVDYGQWTPHNVRRLVKKPHYKGKYPTNPYYPVRKAGGKIVYKPRPFDDPELIFTDIDPIIDPEIWQAVNDRIRENQFPRPQLAGTPDEYQFLMRGRCYCECGYSRSASTDRRRPDGARYPAYRCNARGVSTVGKCRSKAKEHSARAVDAMVWQWVQNTILEHPNLRAALEGLNERKGGTIATLEKQRKHILGLIADVEGRRKRMVDAYEQGAIDIAELTASNKQKDAMLQQYRQSLSEVESKLEEVGITSINVDRILAATEEVRARLDVATLEAKQRLIEMYGVEVTLGYDEEAGERVGYVTCYLTDEPERLRIPHGRRGADHIELARQLAMDVTPRKNTDYV
jgi:DNA invertase Pin-like site-specific DNA recombinase